MRIGKVQVSENEESLAVLVENGVYLVPWPAGCRSLADVLNSPDPQELLGRMFDAGSTLVGHSQVKLLAPIDRQEVWAAGVTYKRSQIARMEESETGASHYDRVYTAPRPEIFFKGTPRRVVGPGEAVRIRVDTQWSVPEPEIALVVSPHQRLLGLTIGNDMSARDIEGENPLYLPQAKVYNQCCALGPCVLVPDGPLDRAGMVITMAIHRGGAEVFRGQTNLDQMKRTFEELIDWLFRDNDFPDGVILLTGTGVVPPNEFTLKPGDVISIDVAGIGTLTNTVVQG